MSLQDAHSPLSDSHVNLLWDWTNPTDLEITSQLHPLNQDHFYVSHDTTLSTGGLCNILLQAVQDPNGHFERLDELLSSRLCHSGLGSRNININRDFIVELATRQLRRLPCTPQRLSFNAFIGDRLAESYPSAIKLRQYQDNLIGDKEKENEMFTEDGFSGEEWGRLLVVRASTTTVVMFALHLQAYQHSKSAARNAKDFLDKLSKMLDRVLHFARHRTSSLATASEAFVVASFLWSTWQSCHMLFLSYVLEEQVQYGYSDFWNDISAIRRTELVDCTEVQKHPQYMCSWAFELLKTSRSSVGADFRELFQTFNAAFSPDRDEFHARCSVDSAEGCDGKRPQSCGRFLDKTRKLVRDSQSVHDLSCIDSQLCEESRLKWCEKSYRSATGARAVSITSVGQMDYCSASDKTLAITHVWSHGQGGRPEDGINKCLHDRYVGIAKAYGCDSYWMDTTSIPAEHELRGEAIMLINQVFSTSKVTLICDRDLMTLKSTTSPPSLQFYESLLATFLVCDWNVRAWTLLEALRGNHNLHVLCADNQIHSIRAALLQVSRSGSMALSILCLATRHFFPHNAPAPRFGARKTIEEASVLLSHRHASREADEFVIWEIFCTWDGTKLSAAMTRFQSATDECEKSGLDTPPKAGRVSRAMAQCFWEAKIMSQESLRTGYLMSTVPRVHGRTGLGWAPVSPYVHVKALGDGASKRQHHSHSGEGSSKGILTEAGLVADWFVHKLDEPLLRASSQPWWATLWCFKTLGWTRFLPWKYDASQVSTVPPNEVLHAVNRARDEGFGHIALFLPAMEDKVEIWPDSLTCANQQGVMMAVCGSKDGGKTWEWQGIYEWNPVEEIPIFEFAHDILLV
jgi:hypothetical protein